MVGDVVMRCERCGTEVLEHASFCPQCGMRLQASVHNDGSGVMTLREAVLATLDEMGVGILRTPRAFMARLMDLCGSDLGEIDVMVHRSDAGFVELFADAAQVGTVEAIAVASRKARIVLVGDGLIDGRIAGDVCKSIESALLEYLRLGGIDASAYGGGADPKKVRNGRTQKAR